MPYIKSDRREELLKFEEVESTGELNFLITSICSEYIERRGLSYSNINDVMGALEGVKFELYRRVASPYEDKKIEQNGDVYPPKLLL